MKSKTLPLLLMAVIVVSFSTGFGISKESSSNLSDSSPYTAQITKAADEIEPSTVENPRPPVPTANVPRQSPLSVESEPMNQPDLDDQADRVQEIEKKLYLASLEFIAETPEGANEVARQIGFNGGYNESARNACGPISVAIMKSAGILPSSTSVREIWLLCPRERVGCNGISVLNRNYFPPQEYDYTKVTESVRTYDFAANPLQTGDWMYLFVSRNGFDHMIVVTRVDSTGAAYTVTNLNRGEGFVITEEMLYDPSRPGVGLFYELTDPQRSDEKDYLGLSGDGGFLLVRRKGGLASLPELNSRLDEVLDPGASWNGLVKELGSSKVLYESLPNQKFHPASMIKIPLAMVVLKDFENKGMTAADLRSEKFGSQTFDQLLTAMVVESDEDASQALLLYLNGQKSTKKILKDWGLNDTVFEPRSTTAFDLASALEGLYSNDFLHPDMRDYLLGLMATYTENDDTDLGILNTVVEGSVFYNKRGTLIKPLIVADMGILEVEDEAYLLVLSGRPNEMVGSNYKKITGSIEAFAEVFSEGIR
ncbi:MAG: serine hydrolase [Anaerolineaceae bacterium]